MGNIQTYVSLLVISVFISTYGFGQKNKTNKKLGKVSKLFRTSTALPIQMSYSNKDLKKLTNDSTYLNLVVTYSDIEENDTLKTLPVRVRARGNFRRKNCYFTPIKIRVKKDDAKGTLFKGNKELKLVVPCLKENSANDNIVKELLAYKLFEIISPYHFKTRQLDLTLKEQKGKKVIEHKLKAFFIEDIDELEDRFGGKEQKRDIHPLQQDSLSSVRNAFFQFMIGNTDFSTGYQHNQKILFVDGFSIPIPYDFDMSGLCDVSYAVVSQIEGEVLHVEKITDRLYRGFKRSDETMQLIREEFLNNQSEMMSLLEDYKTYFENPKEFQTCKNYLLSFFTVIGNESTFKSEILDKRRVK
jgi:hypothetical protein